MWLFQVWAVGNEQVASYFILCSMNLYEMRFSLPQGQVARVWRQGGQPLVAIYSCLEKQAMGLYVSLFLAECCKDLSLVNMYRDRRAYIGL